MTPKQRLRAALIELWHGPLPARDIVRRYHRSYARAYGRTFSPRRLFEIWAEARARGELPDAARPCFAAVAPARGNLDDPGIAIDAAADPELMREIDRSERLSECGESLSRVATDQSLAALRQAHDLDDPTLHHAPADWLKFDLRGVEPPSHARLMQMARDYDAKTRARRSNPAPRLETCA